MKKSLTIVTALVIIIVIFGFGAFQFFDFGPTSTPGSDHSVLPEGLTVSNLSGSWQSSLPGAGGEHLLIFDFDADGSVTFTQEYPSGDAPTVNHGSWEFDPTRSTITATFATETMVFQVEGSQLRLDEYDISLWGERGFTLTR